MLGDEDETPEEKYGPNIPTIDNPMLEEPDPEAKYRDLIPSVEEPKPQFRTESASRQTRAAFVAGIFLAKFGIMGVGFGLASLAFGEAAVGQWLILGGIACLFAVGGIVMHNKFAH